MNDKPNTSAALSSRHDYPDPPAHHNAPPGTSDAAANHIAPRAGTLRGMVLDFIRSRGVEGATDQEIQTSLGLSSNTENPRRLELVQAELVVASGRQRPTRSGCRATVWIATEYAHPAEVGSGAAR